MQLLYHHYTICTHLVPLEHDRESFSGDVDLTEALHALLALLLLGQDFLLAGDVAAVQAGGDILAVGGQIAKAGEFILGPARKAARDVAIPSLFADTTICVAEQIEDAGMLGGAAIAVMRLNA